MSRVARASSTPSTVDLAWAAGLYEGDGSTYRCYSSTGSTEAVEVSQKDPWVLRRLQALFGGSVCQSKWAGPQRQELYRWRVYGARARGFLLTVHALLSPRRQAQSLVSLGKGST